MLRAWILRGLRAGVPLSGEPLFRSGLSYGTAAKACNGVLVPMRSKARRWVVAHSFGEFVYHSTSVNSEDRKTRSQRLSSTRVSYCNRLKSVLELSGYLSLDRVAYN